MAGFRLIPAMVWACRVCLGRCGLAAVEFWYAYGWRTVESLRPSWTLLRPRSGRLHIRSCSLFATLGMLLVFGLQVADAQTSPLSRVEFQQSSSFCKITTPEEAKFVNAISAIVAHGDLTDVAFFEKALETKFQTYSRPNDPGYPVDYSGPYLGDLDYADITVYPPPSQGPRRDIAVWMTFEVGAIRRAPTCMGQDLYISGPALSAYFGGGFHPFSYGFTGGCGMCGPLAKDVINESKELRRVSNGSLGIYMTIEYGTEYNSVYQVDLIEKP
jgi:hypothetical protein